MNISVQVRNDELSEQVRERFASIFQTNLRRFQSRIHRVLVTLGDVNGPKGGVDKRCSVEVRLLGAPSVRLEQRSENFGRAVFQSARRLSHAVARLIRRQRDSR